MSFVVVFLLTALDAFGKLEPGFLVGNWAWLGHFTECSNLKDYHYCLLTLEVDASSLNKVSIASSLANNTIYCKFYATG